MTFVKASLLLVCMSLVAFTVSAQVGAQTPETSAAPVYNGDALEQNNLALGLGFEAAYDDNTFDNIPAQGEGQFSIAPRVAWNITRPRWNSVLDYNGRITRGTRFDFYNRASDTLNASFGYSFSKSLSITASDYFIRSVDPWYSSGAIYGGANPSYLGPPALRLTNGVSAEVDYRLNARSGVTIGGDFYISRFSDIPQASLYDSNSAVGRAGYHRQVSPRLTVGSSYDYSKITSPSGYTTVSQRIMATGQYAFTPHMKLSGFIGPDHVYNSFLLPFFIYLIPIHTAEWSWAGGGSYTWSTSRMTMSLNGSRQVSNGGGLIGNVWLTEFGGQIQRRLSRNYTGTARATNTLNKRLVPQSGQYLNARYLLVGGEISRTIGRDFSVRLAYDRMEARSGYILGDPLIGRNRVTLSINYLFTHPLGR